MERQKEIRDIVRLMGRLMMSAKVRDPKPWLNLEMTREQLRIIFLLSFRDRLSPGEVAETFGVPKANVTSVIERLVEKGFVTRQENPDDRRSYTLSLTDEGRKQVEQLRTVASTRMKRILERMPDESMAHLRIGLESLVQALKEEGEVSEHNRS